VSDDRFLSRWSQRKRLAAAEARKAQEATPAPEGAARVEAEDPFDLSLLPDIETLTPETDISLFLRRGVPDNLKNAALRKMWALDPSVRDYVGDALDYAWDWNAPGGVPGGGELGAGFDTAKMVAQIFGDPPADKNVIEHVAAQHDTPEALASSIEKPGENEAIQLQAGESPAFAPVSGQSVATHSAHPENAAPHKTRRHGGAAPMPSAKSLMS
jgi:hypothetical protein